MKIKENHLKPAYYGYKGGYTKTNKCLNCNLIGMYEDLHETDCCPNCGGVIKNYKTCIWKNINNQYQWIPNEN